MNQQLSHSNVGSYPSGQFIPNNQFFHYPNQFQNTTWITVPQSVPNRTNVSTPRTNISTAKTNLPRNNQATYKQNVQSKTQEDFENYMDFMEKRKEQESKIEDIKFYALLTIPFFILPGNAAANFAASEIAQYYLRKLGCNGEEVLIFVLFMHGLDPKALGKGKLKFVDGYFPSWLTDIYSYLCRKLGVNNFVRIGTKVLLPLHRPRQSFVTVE